MSQLDLIVYGATSFVGQILCRTLIDVPGVKWAMAGRSEAKLRALRDSMGLQAAKLELIIAEASEAPALRAMCERAKVIISTVGPYALYGSTLVEVCAATGTDYCDLTGETQWIRKMIDRHQAAAKASGARIVHCCGFDSLPSDLGVHLVQGRAMKEFGHPCIRVKTRVKLMRGGVSGGTFASMLNLAKESARDSALRRELGNPYSLCPEGPTRASVRQPDANTPKWDGDFKAWQAPFVMAAINTRVVHRTNALLAHRYGHDFLYDEAMLTGTGAAGWARASGLTVGLVGLLGASAVPPMRWGLERFVLPKPGEGPSPQAQAMGYFDFRILGSGNGFRVSAKITGDRDPGYGSTARMVAQAGLCLAMDVPKREGGFWTPAALMGDVLIDRLVANAGLTFEIVDTEATPRSAA